jgi:hypothetical protein
MDLALAFFFCRASSGYVHAIKQFCEIVDNRYKYPIAVL